jgi:hypothetical protein
VLIKSQTQRDKAIERAEAALKNSAAHDNAVRLAIAGRKPLPLNTDVFLKMADILGVPDTELYFFCFCVHRFVGLACGVAKRHEIWQRNDLNSHIKRVKAAAGELEAALNSASQGAHEAIRLCLPWPRVASLEGYVKQARELAAAAETARNSKLSKPWVMFRKLLISVFLSDVEVAGGKLTVSGGDGGTFFEVFACLAPHLPEDFDVSRETLRRIWRAWRRGQKK